MKRCPHCGAEVRELEDVAGRPLLLSHPAKRYTIAVRGDNVVGVMRETWELHLDVCPGARIGEAA